MAWPWLLTLAALAGAFWQARASRRSLGDARADVAALERTAQLTGRDLRDVALRLGTFPTAEAGRGIAALAWRCRALADDLLDTGRVRLPVLRPEPLDLHACVAEAVQTLAATIAPARRAIRVEPPSAKTVVAADRRAVRDVLQRVFAEAAMHTTERDRITVSITPTAPAAPGAGDRAGFLLSVADEGAGLAVPDPGAPGGPDSRGVGASLSRARGLMAAHGGALDVEATLGAGTRTKLWFPASPAERSG